MKILFVCHRVPFPPSRGGKIRPFNIIRHLSKKHSVVVASLAESEEELRAGLELKDHCDGLIAEVLPVPFRWMHAFGALFTTTPSSVAHFWSPQLGRRIQGWLLENSVDLIWVHCAFVAQFVTHLRTGFRILDFGDLDSAKWFDYSRLRAFPLSLAYRLEAWKLKRYESKLAEQFDYCTFTTNGELEEFKRLKVSVPSSVVPNGVDTTYFRQTAESLSSSRVIIFLGQMDYFPNVDAVLHFTTNIFPTIRRSVPDAEFRIIGSNPTRKIQRLRELPGVTVTGYVEDIRPYLADATVSVAPLRIARGVQNKILHSLAMGIPVVTSPQAAMGIQAVPGEHLLVADEPKSFAKHVIDLLRDVTLRRHLSEAARQQVETAHNWSLSMNLVDRILDECTTRAPSSHP